MMQQRRQGVSLIETIACIAIVGTLATGMVGMMRNSARVAAVSQGTVGAPASARQTLRFLTNHIRDLRLSTGATIVSVNARDLRLSDGRRERFELRRSLSGTGRDLVLTHADGHETICVSSTATRFSLEQRLDGGRLVGVNLLLALQENGDRANQLRPADRTTELLTTVCLPPQL